MVTGLVALQYVGIFPDQRSNQCLLHRCNAHYYPLDHQGSPCITFLMFQNLPTKQQNDFNIFPFEGQANLNVMSTNEPACLVSWTFKCYGMTCQLCITTNTSTFWLCRMRNILSVRYSFLCSWHLIALNPSWAWRASCDNLLSNPWGTVCWKTCPATGMVSFVMMKSWFCLE